MAGPTTTLPRFVEGIAARAADFTALVTLISGLYTRALGGWRTRRPAALVRQTTGQSIPSGAVTVLTWGEEARDDADMWAPGANGLTAPIDGWYRVGMTATVAVASAAADATLTGYIIPGSSAAADAQAAHTTRINAPRGHVSVDGVISVTAGTVIRFAVRHTAGVTGATATTFGGCRAWAVWIAQPGNTDTTDPPATPTPPTGGGVAGLGVAPLGTSPLGIGSGTSPGPSGFGSAPFGTAPFGG